MAGEDPDYLRQVRTLPCAAPGCTTRPVQAHHAGARGLGQKASDDTCIPLCERHHESWHSVRAPFDVMGRLGRRVWAATAIEATRAAVERQALALEALL